MIRNAFLPFSSFFRVSSLSYIFRFSIMITPHFHNTQVLVHSKIPECAGLQCALNSIMHRFMIIILYGSEKVTCQVKTHKPLK